MIPTTKVFISMPMKSKSTQQVRTEMQKVFEQIQQKLPNCELIDSVIDGADNHIALEGDDVGVWYVGKSLQLMSAAHIVFFVNDYANYRGCSVEKLVAEKYGKLCVEIQVAL